jgi:hypothetical protein
MFFVAEGSMHFHAAPMPSAHDYLSLRERPIQISASVEIAVVRIAKIGTSEIQLASSFLLAPNKRGPDPELLLAFGTMGANLPTVIGRVHRILLFS